ncbi:MAG: ERF family protein [Oscillospiraceae bacterium]|jgi:hypothetical protein|nr:ERF family protein [Oscillospiraceae bacterium]
MNIYEKVQKIKAELLECNLKKSGNNKFSGFKYYELGDFMPHIIRLCEKYKVCTVISFHDNTASLSAIDSEASENPETSVPMLIISCPIEKLELRGANAIQALGGTQTYLRRYLYMAMFDITENDLFDSVSGKTEVAKTNELRNESKNKPPLKKPGISPEEKDELRALIGDRKTELKLLKQYGVNYLLELNQEQAKEIKERIEKFKAKKEEMKKQEDEKQKKDEKQKGERKEQVENEKQKEEAKEQREAEKQKGVAKE